MGTPSPRDPRLNRASCPPSSTKNPEDIGNDLGGFAIETMRQRGWSIPDTDANFFWLDCAGEGGASVAARLREAGLLVRHFDTERLRHGVRVSIGTDEHMDRFLEAVGSPQQG